MTREQLSAFVDSLAIPEERREIVRAELLDHFDSAVAAGIDPGLGDLAELRARLENVEPAFRFGAVDAVARGLFAATAVGAAIALAGTIAPRVFGGESQAAIIGSELLDLLLRVLLSVVLVLATPLAVRAQLRQLVRRGRVRGCWPAMLYVSLVTWIPIYSLLLVGNLVGSEDVASLFSAPCLVGFVALYLGAVRVRRSAGRAISG